MTPEEFQKDYGAAYRKFQKTPLYLAVMDVLETVSPARATASRPDGDLVAGGHVISATIKGHYKIVNLLRDGLSERPPSVDPEPDYSEPQEPT